MKRGLATYLLMFVCILAMGEDHDSRPPRITFGAEWGYSAAFVSGWHYNFHDPEGFRVDDKDVLMSYSTNGEVTFHVGYNFNEYWNLSLHFGYAGAGDFEPIVPLSIRATRYFGNSHMADRWFAFGDAGSGICLKEKVQGVAVCKFGGGYRLSLSRHTKLDFVTALRFLYTHPDIIYYGESVPERLINRNDGYVVSLNLGIALTF